MGISLEIFNTAEKIHETGNSATYLFTDLIKQFDINPDNLTKDDINRVIEWLDDRGLATVPNLEFAPPKAIIEIHPKRNIDNLYLSEKLPLSSLTCANITREKLPIINTLNLTLNSVAKEVLNNNLNAFLILEDESGKPLGIIDAHSFAKYLNSKNKDTNILETVRPIYICAKNTSSLTETIDLMISENKPYLIITDKNSKIIGFAGLNELFKEYYPLTKPYLLIAKFESLLDQILKEIGFTEYHFESIIPTEQRPGRLNGKTAQSHNLHLSEKITLIVTQKKMITEKFGTNIIDEIEAISGIKKNITTLRNDIFHSRKRLHISREDTEIIDTCVSIMYKFLIIITQKTKS
jgi:CBS domain-containing protein